MRWVPAAGSALALLRRRPRVRVGRRAPGAAARHRAVSHDEPQAVRPRLRGRMDRRAIPDRPRRRRAARARRDGRQGTQLCAAQVPGDTYRNLVVRIAYSRQTFKHILAPVWLMSYTYGARSFQCVQNGVTGAIQGEYPKSPWKIALLVRRDPGRRDHRDVGHGPALKARTRRHGPFAHPGFAPYRRWLRDDRLPGRCDAQRVCAGRRPGAARRPPARVRRACGRRRARLRSRDPARRAHPRPATTGTTRSTRWRGSRFPRAKAALNACHVAEGGGVSANARYRARTPRRCSTNPAWSWRAATILWQLLGSTRGVPCSSAGRGRCRPDANAGPRAPPAREARAPYRALTARALWLPITSTWRRRRRSRRGRGGAPACARPFARDLLPLPVAALPGWDNE